MLPKNSKCKMATKITNDEIRKRMSSKRNIISLQRIKERKLNLFGHVYRIEDNILVKEVVFGEMEGGKKEEDQNENGWTI